MKKDDIWLKPKFKYDKDNCSLSDFEEDEEETK